MDTEARGRPRSEQAEEARGIAARLVAEGVGAVALTFVDNAGLTRVKAVPVARLVDAAAYGVGMPPAVDVYAVDDSATTSRRLGGPVGDLRMFPDLGRLVPLAAQPGWAWAPVDRRTQDGAPYPACQRLFARRLVERARGRGLEFRAGFEVEWVAARADGHPGVVAYPTAGAAYGMDRVIDLSDCLRDLLGALDAQDVQVLQIHPEYAKGQYEVSVAAEDPVGAADTCVLVRQTVRAVSRHHGLRVSFAPSVEARGIGNGSHLHLSPWRGGRNLCHGGAGPHGMTREAESFLAGVLRELPALLAVLAPGVSGYQRLVPGHWAGAFQCWGLENREAALRFVTGWAGEAAANVEIKSADGAANPYLVVGAVIAAGLAGTDAGLSLPPEVDRDPALLPPAERERLGVRRLPASLREALARFRDSAVLREAMGGMLFEAFGAVRQAEVELFTGRTPEEVTAATRWRY